MPVWAGSSEHVCVCGSVSPGGPHPGPCAPGQLHSALSGRVRLGKTIKVGQAHPFARPGSQTTPDAHRDKSPNVVGRIVCAAFVSCAPLHAAGQLCEGAAGFGGGRPHHTACAAVRTANQRSAAARASGPAAHRLPLCSPSPWPTRDRPAGGDGPSRLRSPGLSRRFVA